MSDKSISIMNTRPWNMKNFVFFHNKKYSYSILVNCKIGKIFFFRMYLGTMSELHALASLKIVGK